MFGFFFFHMFISYEREQQFLFLTELSKMNFALIAISATFILIAYVISVVVTLKAPATIKIQTMRDVFFFSLFVGTLFCTMFPILYVLSFLLTRSLKISALLLLVLVIYVSRSRQSNVDEIK